MGKNSLVKSTSKKKTTPGGKDQKAASKEEMTTAAEEKPVAQDKAVAGEAAAKKAAEEKKSAQAVDLPEPEPRVSVSYELPPEPRQDDPMDKMVKIGIGVLVFLFLLIIGASVSNTGKFYIEPTARGIEIWQGTFAPMGKKLLVALPGVEPPEAISPVYGKKDVFPLAFNHYLDKADDMLNVTGIPDFERIKGYLNQALEFSSAPQHEQSAWARKNTIDLNILLYKANVAQNRGTIQDLENALAALGQAAGLELSPHQAELVASKTDQIKESLEELKAEEAAAEEAAAEKAAEQEAAEKQATEQQAAEKQATEQQAAEKQAATGEAPADSH